MSVQWTEDRLHPRLTKLARDVSARENVWRTEAQIFLVGDIVRIHGAGTAIEIVGGEEREYDVGEAAMVLTIRTDGGLVLKRGLGRIAAQAWKKGMGVIILASAQEQPEDDAA